MLHLLAACTAPAFSTAPGGCADLQGDAFAAAIAGLSVEGHLISTVLKSCADVEANAGCVGPSGFEGVSVEAVCPATCGLCTGSRLAESAEVRSGMCNKVDSTKDVWWNPFKIGKVCEWCKDKEWSQIQLCRRSCYVGDSGCAQCHPAAATLELEGGRQVRIDEARVGDKVRAPSGYEKITGFLHAEARHAPYFRFTTAGGASMDISALHHLFANGEETDPAEVAVGDLLETARGPEAVARIEQVSAAGAYHVFVKGGAYYVDGVLASDYVGLVPRAAWPLVRAYVEARHGLGVPIIPVGRGLIPSHAWATEALLGMGAPASLVRALSPLTAACGIGTELLNVAAEHAGAALGAAAAVLAARKLKRQRKA